MFTNSRQGNLFYVLTKGERPSLKIGQVESVSNPTPKYPTYNPQQPFGTQTEMVVDIKVKCGEEVMDFQKLPASGEVFTYPNAVVSDKKEAILAEVEAMMQTSKQIIESVPYNESVIESCDEILKQLNPQFAKEKQQEEKIGSLEGEVKSLKGDLNEIKNLLLKMSSNNNNSNNSKSTNKQ